MLRLSLGAALAQRCYRRLTPLAPPAVAGVGDVSAGERGPSCDGRACYRTITRRGVVAWLRRVFLIPRLGPRRRPRSPGSLPLASYLPLILPSYELRAKLRVTPCASAHCCQLLLLLLCCCALVSLVSGGPVCRSAALPLCRISRIPMIPNTGHRTTQCSVAKTVCLCAETLPPPPLPSLFTHFGSASRQRKRESFCVLRQGGPLTSDL